MHSVLVIEDDDTRKGVLGAWIDALDYRYREAGSADDALAAMEREAADIVLCSVSLRDSRGIWLASRLRAWYPSTAIIMAARANDLDTALSVLRTEAVDYLQWPFDRARLREALALGRDFHTALEGKMALHNRLRTRQTPVETPGAETLPSANDEVDSLVSKLEAHERDSRGHGTRVASLATAIAEKVGLAPHSIAILETAALLHDIGKLDLPRSILSKPAPLDDLEWAMMRTHPQVGHDRLKEQPRLSEAADIVLSHHEAYDGSGYPRGLAGTDIPLAARILTVADAYDAMTMPRTQRPPMLPVMAVREIERCRNRQFDPLCVEALGDVLAAAAGE